MTTQVKNLVFKGIEKKEQILFKSFLNLAKNELTYQVDILKDADSGNAPDFVMKDDSYTYSDDEQGLSALPTIIVGNDVDKSGSGYISRPVQWSDFRTELTRLDMQAAQAEAGEEPDDRVLPEEMEFVIADMGASSESDIENTDSNSSEAPGYEYELDNMSVDYHSFTNSEYMKVVDEVQGFNEGDPMDDKPQGVVMMTDDESASSNSVLVIETNSLDVWEMSESEFEEDGVLGQAQLDEDGSFVDEKAEKAIDEKLQSGTPVKEGDEYWNYDMEIFSGRESLLFIKPERDMVYSEFEPAKWSTSLAQKDVVKIPIQKDWHPTEGLKAYPVSRLMWASTIATKTAALAEGLNESSEYILERWPDFELLELDNVLLKLCTLLFVNSESAYSLMQKSGHSRHVVFGLLNACYELGILKNASEIQIEQFSKASNDESVFGKIKDVFR